MLEGAIVLLVQDWAIFCCQGILKSRPDFFEQSNFQIIF
jgi:hypothetical protein